MSYRCLLHSLFQLLTSIVASVFVQLCYGKEIRSLGLAAEVAAWWAPPLPRRRRPQLLCSALSDRASARLAPPNSACLRLTFPLRIALHHSAVYCAPHAFYSAVYSTFCLVLSMTNSLSCALCSRHSTLFEVSSALHSELCQESSLHWVLPYVPCAVARAVSFCIALCSYAPCSALLCCALL